MEALFGKEQINYSERRQDIQATLTREADGVWIQHGPKPRYTRLNGVLMFRDIDPWNLRAPLCLYLNPFVDDTRLPRSLYRLPHATGKDGRMHWVEGEDIEPLILSSSRITNP